MRKLAMSIGALVLLLGAGLYAWNAEATTAGAAATLGQKNYSPIVKEAACGGWGRHCPPGYIWRCGPWRCWCRPC